VGFGGERTRVRSGTTKYGMVNILTKSPSLLCYCAGGGTLANETRKSWRRMLTCLTSSLVSSLRLLDMMDVCCKGEWEGCSARERRNRQVRERTEKGALMWVCDRAYCSIT
jgi:hypothetical protein